MMNIEELRKIFCEDGLYAVCEPPRVSWRVFYL